MNRLSKKQQALGFIQAKKLAEARELFAEVCREDANDAEAWFMLGALSGKLGSMDEAIHCCREAVRLRPDYTEAHYNLAQAYVYKRNLPDAIESYRKVIQLQPNHAIACNQLGYVLCEVGRHTEARQYLEQALRLNPEYADAYVNLGNAFLGLKDPEQAQASFRQALQLSPNSAVASHNLGLAFKARGELEQAEVHLRTAIRLKPDYASAHANLGNVLADVGNVAGAVEQYREVLRLQPKSADVHSNLVFVLNYVSNEPAALFAEHAEWGRRHESSVTAYAGHSNNTNPDRVLRVGYVSPDFCAHSVSFFIKALLSQHDRERVQSFCYSDVKNPDAITAQLRALTDHWRETMALTDQQLAELIRSDQIDILVDLAGHSAGSRLLTFARRPAPVQVTYLGYPNTTGLRSIDYRLTDAWADPPGPADEFHMETLVRLEAGFLCYTPLSSAPAATATERPAGANIVFGCFNNLPKISIELMDAWARILRAVPGSRLLLKGKAFGTKAVRERYLRYFAERGIASDRIELLAFIPSIHYHLALYERIDVALDTFPYNGTTTTCEALWMGVPVVTLAGATHASRVGVSLLSQVGLPELIATDIAQYIEKAVSLAIDSDTRARLRAGLREKMASSPLCQAEAFARKMEEAYREMWRQWCRTRPDRLP
jgi:predicted O-linked N-acetylglucosamine transferase (SPINDLY family)